MGSNLSPPDDPGFACDSGPKTYVARTRARVGAITGGPCGVPSAARHRPTLVWRMSAAPLARTRNAEVNQSRRTHGRGVNGQPTTLY